MMYLDERTQVSAITSNPEGNAMVWLVSLHDEEPLELQDLDAFMQVLWDRFKFRDPHLLPMTGQAASSRIHPRFSQTGGSPERLAQVYIGLPIPWGFE